MKRKAVSEQELFESIPVPRAVATLAVPTIISQVVTMIYNLADTFFVGQIGDPYMVAAVSLVSPWFNLLTALGNLFGLGGGSLISRLLGKHDQDDIKNVSAFSVWGGAVTTLLFSVLTFAFREPLLYFLGASPDTFGYAQSYLTWVVVIGGVPTMLSLSLGHLLRSEGHARPASMGMMFGGILNVILDPALIFGFQLDVTGAAIATAFSNLASVVFFVVIYIRLGERTAVSLHPRHFTFRFVRQIFSVGLASALATALGNASNMVIVKLSSGYGDIPEAQTSALGTRFLRIACLAVPLTSVNFLISYTLQAMGKGTQSAILTFSRQGLLNIPLLILMDRTVGLYGMIWTQLVVEVIMLPVSFGMYMHTLRGLRTAEQGEHKKGV